ncbi:endolytic transglycosylase MltG [Luteimonas sp. BDR2-5]|uniref:endolytic transglycosylase MltG n=1 Tax=Proluteimonas luteida TaxID=2878685 RepID=UPI001E3D8F73|nr:endolytic transglycosylase MltG [Luteimonas sp. BDR2-5]MCD9028463.1 endolytic transglycosylase MltG [Luteimonas sp. BDR2-5]
MTEPAKPRRRGIGLILVGLFLVLSVLLVGAGYFLYERYTRFADAPLAGLAADQTFVVARGDSFQRVLGRLREAGVTQGHELEWRALARQLGADARIQVGEYPLDPGTTPRELLLRMRDGKVIHHRFTIVEGWNIRELRAALGRTTPLVQTLPEIDDAALMAELGHPGVHPEGRFLPETYLYTTGDSDVDLLRRANAALEAALDRAWESRDPGLALQDREEALVLASIIEKETGIASERAEISGVFNRRLERGMRLQTDPTVIYGLGSAFDGNIRRRDLQTDTPYNTYTRDGLPPTPIAMAGVAAIEAATHPAPGDALYFVAVGDGSGRHVFSPTYAAHNVAVRDYVRRYRARFGRGDASSGSAAEAAAGEETLPPNEAEIEAATGAAEGGE